MCDDNCTDNKNKYDNRKKLGLTMKIKAKNLITRKKKKKIEEKYLKKFLKKNKEVTE